MSWLARSLVIAAALPALALSGGPAGAAAEKWVTAWAASVQGPYPVGNPSAQPDLRFAFPSAETGARDQTFRLTVRPDIWGDKARLRFSNAFGTKPLTLDGVFIGLQLSGAAVIHGSNRPVTISGKRSVTIAPGQFAWSDAAPLGFAGSLTGRKLAVSLHVVGESGPMTWHAKGLTTSYLTPPGSGAKGTNEAESDFPTAPPLGISSTPST
jgi:hypothetical protein